MNIFKKLNDNYFIYVIFLFIYLPLVFLPQLFDGVSFTYIYRGGDFEPIRLMYSEGSRHFHLFVYFVIFKLVELSSISAEFFFDFFALLFLVLLCIEIKLYAKLLFYLEKKWCNIAALFVALFPVWHTLVAINITQYLISIYFLFFGYRYFISKNVIKIFIGIIAIIFSFNLESNLSFIIGLGFIHYLLSKFNTNISFPKIKLVLVIVISLSYYFIKDIYFPPYGFWADYNQVSFESVRANLFNLEILNKIYNFSTYLLYYIWIPLIFLIHLIFINKNDFFNKKINLKYFYNYYLLIFLSSFAIFPYLLANSNVPSLLYLSDYYQRHAFLLAPIFGIFFAMIFRDMENISFFKNKPKISIYLITFICFNLILLNYGTYRKIESYLFQKNLVNELQKYKSLPKGNVKIISKHMPADLRVFEVNHIFYQAYGAAGWWGRPEGPSEKYLKDPRYAITYIFNDYKNECKISVYLKNDLDKFERIKKFYILNYKNYYNIDKIDKKC